jgi:predicted DNA-binding protein
VKVTVDTVIAKYIELRDKKERMDKEHKARLAPMSDAMEKLEAYILKNFQETGIESARTDAGTAYVATRSSTTVADKEAFLDFVKQSEAWHLLDVRALKTAVEEYLTVNQTLPTGVNLNRVIGINVRKS